MLFHYSEDPTIELFEPHVPPSNPGVEPAVWAIDEQHSPLYWFPRQCPRGTVWARDAAEQAVLAERFATSSSRVHVTELGWLDRIRACELFVYEFDPGPFRPWSHASGQWTATSPVVPRSVAPVGDLLALHAVAGIELRFVENVWPFWDQVVECGLDFSGVRLSNAVPRP